MTTDSTEVNAFVEKIHNALIDGAIESHDKAYSVDCKVDAFYKTTALRRIRYKTMLLLYRLKDKLKGIEWDENMSVEYITSQMVKRYRKHFVNTIEKIDIADYRDELVPDDVWEKAIDTCLPLKANKHYDELEFLFHIMNPETDHRKRYVETKIEALMESPVTFSHAVYWITCFDLRDLKEKVFADVCYRAHIFNILDVLNNFLSTCEEKQRYVHLLDDCLAHRNLTGLRLEFYRTMPQAKMAGMIAKLTRRFGFDIDKLNLAAQRIRIINEIRYKFHSQAKGNTPDFVKFALQAMEGRDDHYKSDLIRCIVDRRNYVKEAVLWARYFKIPPHKCPAIVNQHYEEFNKESRAFNDSLRSQISKPLSTDDKHISCHIMGEQKQVYVICTPLGLERFIEQRLVLNKPGIIGMDCEAGTLATGTNNKVTLLQLATNEWLSLVDVYMLEKTVSRDGWANFFKALFAPDIERLGFSFLSDYSFLVNMFPFLTNVFQEPSRNVICLSKMIMSIQAQPDAKAAVFGERVLAGNGLAVFCEDLLGIPINKDMQNSNWVQRPLSVEQIQYAASDSYVLLKIYDKIMGLLEEGSLDRNLIQYLVSSSKIHYSVKTKGSSRGDHGGETDTLTTKPASYFTEILHAALDIGVTLQDEVGSVFSPKELSIVVDLPFTHLIYTLNKLGLPVAFTGTTTDQIVKFLASSPKTALITSNKRKNKEYKNVKNRMILLSTGSAVVSVENVRSLLDSLNCVIDDSTIFKLCEKCATPGVKPLPSPIYVLCYGIFALVKGIGSRFGVTMNTVLDYAQAVKMYNSEDYKGYDVRVFIEPEDADEEDAHSPPRPRPPRLVMETVDYRIAMLDWKSFKLIPKNPVQISSPALVKSALAEGDVARNLEPTPVATSFPLKLYGTPYQLSHPGFSHLACMACGNVYSPITSIDTEKAMLLHKKSQGTQSNLDTSLGSCDGTNNCLSLSETATANENTTGGPTPISYPAKASASNESTTTNASVDSVSDIKAEIANILETVFKG